MDTWFMRISLMAVAVMGVGLLGLFELGVGYPVAWWLYGGCFVAFGAGILRRKQYRAQIGGIVIWAVLGGVCWLLYELEWNSRKGFLRDLNKVQIGMSESEVREIMAGYMEGTGWPESSFGEQGPDGGPKPLYIAGSDSSYATTNSESGEMMIAGALVFRHSDEGSFNSDWGIVSFTEGKVTGVKFSPD